MTQRRATTTGFNFKYARHGLIAGMAMLLCGCITGLWTGASLFYDRHRVYKSLSDYELITNAKRALNEDDLFDCIKCHLDIAVFNGDILIAGHVETTAMREEAERRIKAEPGYRRVFNELSTNPIRTNIARDSWITSKICSRMIANADIDPSKFKVITSDRIVYLMGDVLPEQADQVVAIAQNTSDVEKVVKLLNYYHLSSSRERPSTTQK